MKRIIVLLLTFFNISLLAQEVEVSVNPQEPVKGEVFDLKFKVTMTSNDKPYISFTPNGLEVLERVAEPEYHFEIRGGIGRAQTTKTLTYTYKLVANKAGVSYVRDIVIEIGKEKIRHNTVNIRVLNQRKELPEIFARAEINKEEIVLGEGIDVRYYVYSLYPVIQTEIKSFPKLNGFIKRFHKPMEAEEAIRVDGKVYRRSLKYSARVYPEKTGELTIDPIRLDIQYAGGSVNPFGNLGFGFNRFKKKSLNSERIKVKVTDLPVEGLPSSFTGLVGNHEFKLTMTKNKFLVNEAIEARLEVTGSGALEKLDAPRLFMSEALEKFDDKSDFQELGLDQGRKIFEYTYLARANVEIPERKLELGFYDPETKEYKTTEILIPSLTIGGGGSVVQVNNQKKLKDIKNENLRNDVVFHEVPSPKLISAPLFDTHWKSIPINWSRYLIFTVVLVVLIQIGELFYHSIHTSSGKDNLNKIFKESLKQGATYNAVVNLVFLMDPKQEFNGDMFKIIEESQLKRNEKKYFIDLIKELEMSSYSRGKTLVKKKVKSTALKSLKKEIERQLGVNNLSEINDERFKLDSRAT